MIPFKNVTLCDKSWVDELVRAENSPSADYNFGNLFIWDRRYRQLIARCGDRMLTKLRYDGRPAFVFPIEREYPGRFSYREDTDNADYIYLAEKLATYAGKALHGKKNHCNRFEAENDWDFVPITRELIPACLDMLVVWNEENAARLDPSVVYEHDAVVRAFAAYERLGLEGGALRVGGKIVGFTMGEMCSADTFDVHFEKADGRINGAYPMVCRELTRMLLARHPGLVRINREDDMGLEPLRRSKESYKPEYLLKKYTASWIDGGEEGENA